MQDYIKVYVGNKKQFVVNGCMFVYVYLYVFYYEHVLDTWMWVYVVSYVPVMC